MRNPEVWIILAVLAIVLFGAKKMPDAARGLGRSLRIFKAEIKGLNDDDTTQPNQATPQPAPQAQLPAAYQQPVAAPMYQQPAPAPAPAATAAPAPAPVAADQPAERREAQ